MPHQKAKNVTGLATLGLPATIVLAFCISLASDYSPALKRNPHSLIGDYSYCYLRGLNPKDANSSDHRGRSG